MTTQTIQQIEHHMDLLKEALQSFVVAEHKGNLYGPEEEYTPQTLKAGIKAILTDIRGLVKVPSKFVRLSNLHERNGIVTILNDMNNMLDAESYNEVANKLDELKPIIRNYGVRGSSETKDILIDRINKLNAQSSIFEENLNAINRTKEKSEEAILKIEAAEEKIASLNNIIAEVTEKIQQTEDFRGQSEEDSQSIGEFLSSVKSHEEIVRSFSQQVEQRQTQLDSQQAMTNKYMENLKSYEKERGEKLKEAEGLIKQAREALGYKTAEGISAAFNERYTEEKRSGRYSWLWLAFATIFVGGGVGLIILLSQAGSESGYLAVVSRFATLPILFASAWFCASQYIRYRNTRDDYGYKSVLSKSMVAFLDQFTDKREREYYLATILSQIHQDPLRKKHDVDTPITKALEMFRRKESDKDIDDS